MTYRTDEYAADIEVTDAELAAIEAGDRPDTWEQRLADRETDAHHLSANTTDREDVDILRGTTNEGH